MKPGRNYELKMGLSSKESLMHQYVPYKEETSNGREARLQASDIRKKIGVKQLFFSEGDGLMQQEDLGREVDYLTRLDTDSNSQHHNEQYLDGAE